MKKLFALLTIITLLAGCATGPDKAALLERKEAVNALSKVEIFYNSQDKLAVIDLGGSNLSGLGGLFGPVGMLIAVGADAGSKLTMAERAESRSNEFMSAIEKGGIPQTLNEQFAEALATRIRSSGREVKITPTERIQGAFSRNSFPEAQLTPGYAPLILRITTGYGAPDALSSYRPVITIEQALKNVDQARIYQQTYTANSGEPSFLRYDTLLEQFAAAHAGIRQGLVNAVDPVYRTMFVYDNVASSDK